MGRLLRSQIAGLVFAIVLVGAILAGGGGSVSLPAFTRSADGTRHRVMTHTADGRAVPAVVSRNKFANLQNFAQLAKDTSFTAIMAVGMAIVIIGGGIDLSVGSTYALASVVGALVLQHFGPDGPGGGGTGWFPVLAGVAACLGTGLLAGCCNGALVIGLRVHSFVVTLGTMAVFRGLAFVLTNGQSIGSFPPRLQALVRWEIGEQVSVVPMVVMLLVLLAGFVFLARLVAGRRVYAVGGNEVAARFSAIAVARTKFLMYALSGLSAGIAALLALGYYGAATSGDGQGYELTVIAAAVVGGASLSGGRGTALGAVLGALLIQMIASGIVILGIDQNYSQIVIGAVVIAAVALDQLSTWLVRRRALAASL